MKRRAKDEIKLQARSKFYLKLLQQEVIMFGLLQAPVYLPDINWVCKRRGFNTKERVSLMNAMRKIGLWRELPK